jgi:glutaredoxin
MVWGWLRRWWSRSSRKHWRFILYTRSGCHLCETAWQQLERARRRYGFVLEIVDIDTDADLIRQYSEQIPVVAVNGVVRFRGTVNPVLLERLFAEKSHPDAPKI